MHLNIPPLFYYIHCALTILIMKKKKAMYPVDITLMANASSLEILHYGVDNKHQIRILISLFKLGKVRYTEIVNDTKLSNNQISRQLKMMLKNRTISSELHEVGFPTIFDYELTSFGFLLGGIFTQLKVEADKNRNLLLAELSLLK